MRTKLQTTNDPHFVVLTCDTDADEWHVTRGLDPDQWSLAVEIANDYLARLREGSQVAIAEVRHYGVVESD